MQTLAILKIIRISVMWHNYWTMCDKLITSEAWYDSYDWASIYETVKFMISVVLFKIRDGLLRHNVVKNEDDNSKSLFANARMWVNIWSINNPDIKILASLITQTNICEQYNHFSIAICILQNLLNRDVKSHVYIMQ